MDAHGDITNFSLEVAWRDRVSQMANLQANSQ